MFFNVVGHNIIPVLSVANGSTLEHGVRTWLVYYYISYVVYLGTSRDEPFRKQL